MFRFSTETKGTGLKNGNSRSAPTKCQGQGFFVVFDFYFPPRHQIYDRAYTEWEKWGWDGDRAGGKHTKYVHTGTRASRRSFATRRSRVVDLASIYDFEKELSKPIPGSGCLRKT